MSIIESLISDQKEEYKKKFRSLGYFFTLLVCIGFTLDIAFNDNPVLIYYIDLASILLSVIAIILFYFKKIQLGYVFRLQIIGLLVNMIASHFLHPVDSPDFTSCFLRNSMTIGMLVPICGLFCNKKDIFHIGFVYVLLYVSSLVRGSDGFLVGNAPFLLFNGVIYILAIFFILDSLEKLRAKQNRLNKLLKQRNGLFITVINDLKQKNEQINQQSKMLKETNATRDKLYSVIAHDLRSPFNSIVGFSDLLLENDKNYEPDHSREIVSLINTTAKHTFSLLENLLAWTQMQTGEIHFNPKNLRIHLLIREIIDVLESSAQIKNITLKYTASEKIEIRADPAMLQIIIRNLIQNAIKFTHRGGEIDIKTTTMDNKVIIVIEDNGVGMNDDTQKRLFKKRSNPSNDGTENEKGSGLGLILCKEFVKAHNGKILVESNVGEGSIFMVTLPQGIKRETVS